SHSQKGSLGFREGDKAPGPAAPASPFQRLVQARRLQDLSGDGGVLKEVLRPGAGEPVAPDASVAVKYSGYLEYADEPFCTNCYRKLPRLMKLGKGKFEDLLPIAGEEGVFRQPGNTHSKLV
uniref:FKBP prolyl isomerase 6 n=1 Tax=Dromaius novaehollandiae TaxID=8790 RepID=A0A8C4KLS7_DRONO